RIVGKPTGSTSTHFRFVLTRKSYVRQGPIADIGSLGKRQSDRLLRTSSQLNCSNPICEYVLSGRTPDLLSALWRRDAFSWRRTGKQHSRSIYFRVRRVRPDRNQERGMR